MPIKDETILTLDFDFAIKWLSKLWTSVKQFCLINYRLNPNYYKITFMIKFVVLCIICPLLCQNLPYSFYWMENDTRALIQQATTQNQVRFVISSSYVHSLTKENEIMEPDLVIGVVTVHRTIGSRVLGYLTQVMAQAHKLSKAEQVFSQTVQIIICDAHAGPGPHTEADVLDQYFIRKQRFPKPDPSAVIMDRFEKEKQDYTFCLQQSLEYKPKYVMILEDDAVLINNSLSILKLVIHRLNKKKSVAEPPWGFLKLFYPLKWQGYGLDLKSLMELSSIGSISGCAFTYLYIYARGQKHKLNMNIRILWFPFVIGFSFLVLLCLLIGRPHLIQLKRISRHLYSTRPAPDCCSPGILYPASIAMLLQEKLNRTVCNPYYPFDMALAAFMNEIDNPSFIVEPNLVNHIGLISSIKGISNSPWDFIF